MTARDIAYRCANLLNQLKGEGVISSDMITKYTVSSRESLHSYLQYVLIRAAEEEAEIKKSTPLPLPEYKIRLKQPLDPSRYGLSGKKRYYYRTDVGY